MFASIRNRFRHPAGRARGFSILCAYNNHEKLDHYLLNSLHKQTMPYELLTIDNCDQQHECAARVLNQVARKARGDYLMFVHQDVALCSSSWLADVKETLDRLDLPGAAGVAGCDADHVYASVSHGSPPEPALSVPFDRPVPVQTLDGCLLIVPRAVFLEQGFDEETCEGWYLYIADYCLDLARRNLNAYVLPHAIIHESMGPSDPRVYEKVKANLLKKHHDRFDTIHTTIGGKWATRSDCSEPAAALSRQ